MQAVVPAHRSTENICVIRRTAPSYPSRLRELAHPPEQLYVRGASMRTDIPLISVVGTRRISDYGRRALEHILPPLVRAGIGVVSGLAFGVDTVAHTLTLDHRGYTIAVLPGAADDASIFPTSNRALARRICANSGTLVTENSVGATIQSFSFPLRNRIIAGLTSLTIVIEAPQKSGALITANLALDANRDIGAVPGPITSRTSDGCNSLLRRGAYPITCASDVLEILNLKAPDTTRGASVVFPDECKALEPYMADSAVTVDELIEHTQLPPAEVLRMITTAEILGCIRAVSANTFVRIFL